MTPRTLEAVTVPWLASVLSAADPSALQHADVEPFDANIGLLSTMARATLTWRDDRIDHPASVVIKLASTNEANRSISEQFGYYRREVEAYRNLLPADAWWAPSCNVADLLDDGSPCLVLEDLPRHEPGDQLAGLTLAQAEAAIDTAAAFHTLRWNDPRLLAHEWLPHPKAEVVSIYGDLFSMMWGQYCDRFGGDPAHLAAAEQAMDRWDAVIDRFAKVPQTLIHGDYRLDNLLFDPKTGSAVAIDWQLAARGRGPYDLAFLLAGSADPAWRKQHEAQLVRRYFDGLQAGGVTGYEWDDCWADYRFGHIQNLPNPITAAVVVEPNDDRGAELLAENARRALSAVHDHWGRTIE